jgi:hypothetical protein
MGRDEHRSRKNKRLGQTPKQQLIQPEELETEFAEEIASAGDRNTEERVRAQKKRQ